MTNSLIILMVFNYLTVFVIINTNINNMDHFYNEI